MGKGREKGRGEDLLREAARMMGETWLLGYCGRFYQGEGGRKFSFYFLFIFTKDICQERPQELWEKSGYSGGRSSLQRKDLQKVTTMSLCIYYIKEVCFGKEGRKGEEGRLCSNSLKYTKTRNSWRTHKFLFNH